MLLKDLYYKLSIKSKIVILFFSIIVIITLTLGLYSEFTSQKYVVNKISYTNLGVVKQINSNIDFMQKDITDLSTYIAINQDVRKVLDESSSEAQNHLDQKENILEFIAKLLASKSYISTVIIYNSKGEVVESIFSDASTGARNAASAKEKMIFDTADSLNGKPLWFPVEKQSKDFIQINSSKKIAMCRVIKDINFDKHVGYLILFINEKTIQNMYLNNIQDDTESIMISDNKGNLISGYGGNILAEDRDRKMLNNLVEKEKEGYVTEKVSNKDMLLSYSSNNASNWKIYYAVPIDTLTGEINSIKTFTLVIILACLLFSFPLMIFLSALLTSPIKKLTESMKKFQQGNFDTRVDFKFKDEMGVLGDGYNSMVVNIKQLIDTNYILQIREREAELNSLQAQINPHFLYNTLETIYWEAEGAGQKKISEMVISLSRLFRLSLNRGKSLTSIANEKDMIKYYLELQKMRFKDKLNYTLRFDPILSDFIIPKLIIQPFVENAILHGIEPGTKDGFIEIRGSLKEDKIQFIIRDNGVGMTPDKTKSLFSDKDTSDISVSRNPGGYAVKNVNERLRLYFKNDYSLKITSTPGIGTNVEIIVPIIEANEDQEA